MNRVGLWGKPVVILGAGKTGAHLARDLQKEWSLGFRPVAVFDDQLAPVGGMLEGVPYRGTLSDAMNLPRKQATDTAIFAMSHAHCKHLDTFISQASLRFRYVIVIPDPAGVTTSAVVARDLAGTLGVEIKHNLLRPWVLRAKRMLDLSIAIVVVPLMLPLLLMISLLVWIESHGHVLYKAQRMGQDSKLFWCVKFRTMVPDAESALQRILEENAEIREEYLKYHKLRDDPRVTRVGRFLRKTSLDELPQLWNVLRGEMSLVGPRPYLPRESAKIGAAQGEILRVPPGITGLWQVAGRSRTYFNERVQMDTYYVRNWSIWLDFIILARTLGSVVLDGKLSERF
jgi:Undecaprenyl-phosphate galactose phosphotransferase WbaP